MCKFNIIKTNNNSLKHPVVVGVHRERDDEGKVAHDEDEPEEGRVEVVAEDLDHQGQADHGEHVVSAGGDVRVAELES